MRKLILGACALILVCPSLVSAQMTAYPIAWPKAGGGTLVAVPVADASVQVYHMVGAPHGSAYDTPFPQIPALDFDPAPAGVPIILRAPIPPIAGNADEDNFFILVSNH